MRVIHGGEQVRLLEQQAAWLAFEQRDVVPEQARVIGAGAAAHGVPDYGVQSEAPRGRLLDQAKGPERIERALGLLPDAREGGQRRPVDVVAFDVSEHREHTAARRREAAPRPIDEQRHFGQVVLVLDGDDSLDAALAERRAEPRDRFGTRLDNPVGDVERERVEAQ